jgi:streptomycin 6-kinase
VIDINTELARTVDNFGAHGRGWLDALPATIDRLTHQWELTVDEPGPDGSCSYLLAARRTSGEPAMLKVSLPHREAEREPDALAVWDGDGAVRLLELDATGAMLLERIEPGTPLALTSDYDAMARIGAELVGRLHVPAPDGHPFELLTDVCAEWAMKARDRVRSIGSREDVPIVDEGAELLDALPREASEHVLLHGDFHHWNVLAGTREPWLAIDAKPMVGDPVFDCAQFLGNHYGIADDREAFVRGVDVFADASGFDRQRMLSWVFAKSAEDAMWGLSTEQTTYAMHTLDYARFIKELMR